MKVGELIKELLKQDSEARVMVPCDHDHNMHLTINKVKKVEEDKDYLDEEIIKDENEETETMSGDIELDMW